MMGVRKSRRDVLKQIGMAGATALVPAAVLRGEPQPILVAGKPVEILVASISPKTVRITVRAVDGGASVPDDGALVAAPLTLVVYPGADGLSSVYEDDGKTFAHRTGQWMRMEMDWRDSARRLTLRLARGSRMLPPAKRAIEVRVAGERSAQRVDFDGRTLEIKLH